MLRPIDVLVAGYSRGNLSVVRKSLKPSPCTPESVVLFVRNICGKGNWQSEDGKVSRERPISRMDFKIMEGLLNRHMENVWNGIIDRFEDQNLCAVFASSIYEAVVDWREIRKDEITYQKAMSALIPKISKKAEELKSLLADFEEYARTDPRRGVSGWVTSSDERALIHEALNALTDEVSQQTVKSSVADVDVILSSQKEGGKSDLIRAFLMAMKRNDFPYRGIGQSAGKGKMWTLMADAMSVITGLEFNPQDFYKMDMNLSDYLSKTKK